MQANPISPITPNNQTPNKPLLHHLVKMSDIWPKLTDVCVKKNSKLIIELHKIQRLTKDAINKKEAYTVEEEELSTAWERMKSSPSGDTVLFGTHMKLEDQTALSSMLKKIEPYYRLDGKHDIQRFYGFNINGLNEAQFFFKANGAWTALHVEDCGLATFNVNVGPGTSRWTLIHADEINRLSTALSRELRLKKPIDIRWHPLKYFVTEQFLIDNEIKHEVVDQKPGYGLYAPGYVWHQVENIGCGLNVAWNIALMHMEAVVGMIEAFNTEVQLLKKIPMAPVPRVVHSLIITHREMLDKAQHNYLLDFLLKQAQKDKRCYDAAQKKRETAKKKIETRVLQKFAFNNCEECALFFYGNAFVWDNDGEEVEYCHKCIADIPLDTLVYRKTIFDEGELIRFLTARKNGMPQDDRKDDQKTIWRYPHDSNRPLEWVIGKDDNETILEILQRNTKLAKTEAEIERVESKINDIRLKAAGALQKRQQDEFEVAVNRQLQHLEKLKKCKDKLNTE